MGPRSGCFCLDLTCETVLRLKRTGIIQITRVILNVSILSFYTAKQSPAEELVPEICTFYKESTIHKMNWYVSLGNQGLQSLVGKEVNQVSCNFASHRKKPFGFKTNLPPAIRCCFLLKTCTHLTEIHTLSSSKYFNKQKYVLSL